MTRNHKLIHKSGLIFICNESPTFDPITICNHKNFHLLALRYLWLVLLVFLSQWAKAQVPVANFSGTPLRGCAPLVVSFKDESTGDPKFWNWDLGNGQLSNAQSPVVVYSQPGVYSVTLVVKNANGTHGITKTDYITVLPSPQADFMANITSGCVPVNVQFRDLSNDPAGTITSWEWDFGDGTKSTEKNPQKTYSVNGFYSVSLTVISSTGCRSAIGKSRYMRIVSGVKADFTSNTTGACQPPYPTKFTNQSSGPGTLTYAWDFGNGITSNAPNPNAVYNAAGTYTVSLTTSSDYGCGNSIQKSVTIRSSNTTIGGADSICVNRRLNLLNSSAPAPVSAIWYFDDGTQSTGINSSKVFTTPGPHVVKLVNTYSFCKDSVTKTIQVLTPPPVDFTSSTVIACKAPLTVNFSDASPSSTAWNWNFGDGTTSTERNPTHTYNSAGQFNVSLTITTSFGCTNTLVKNVFVQIVKPAIGILGAPTGGCVPFTFTPTADIRAVDGVSSYQWNFGDGPGSTRTGANPSYTYNNPGTYPVTLTVTTLGGCTETITVPAAVKTGTPPVIAFTANKTTGCATDSFYFTSTSSPQANAWLWDFGDGSSSDLENPANSYKDTGKLTVSLIAFNNGCPSAKLVKPDYITITPPVAKFRYANNSCSDRYTINFTNTSIADPAYPENYVWDFGDGSPTTTQVNPTHRYADTGTYKVKLTVSDARCRQTTIQDVWVVNEQALMKASKSAVCKNEKVTISSLADTFKIKSYQWRIGSGTPFSGKWSFDTSFAANGSYDVELTITDTFGCTDTKIYPGLITVVGPVASFTNAAGSCKDNSATFTDQTTSAARINRWTWDFGDSTIRAFTAPPFTHLYKDTGVYSVKLIVQDVNGCTDTLKKDSAIIVTKPVLSFHASDTIYCQGADLQFLNNSEGYGLSYSWDFGDGGSSTLREPVHAYTGRDSSYTVSLKITDQFGCRDSLTRIKYIDVRLPKSAFKAADTISICPPLEAKFFFEGKDYESFYWEFGDGSGSALESPRHFYNSYGTFVAKLYLVGFGGCVDSSSHLVNVYNPNNSIITYGPLDACNSLNVDFSITTPPQTHFTFYYGDGRLDSSQSKTFSHFYNSPNFYYPSLILYDSLGCLAPVGGRDMIKVLGSIPNFARDRREFCDSGLVYFTNYTIANDSVISSVWNFDDGSTSTDRDPFHNFASPDQYAVSLSVTTQAGCTSSLIDTIKVYRTPDVSIISLDTVCLNTPVLFDGRLVHADTAITWKWDIGNGRTASTEDVSSLYSRVGNHTVSIEAANRLGCKDTSSKIVYVAPLPVIEMGPDPVIPVGTGINLPVSYGSKNIKFYTWTPASNLSCQDCSVPYANPTFTTRYRVTVTDSNGCRSSDDVMVRVACTEKNYFVPNTFSPNGDGVNDVFYPRGASIDRIQAMRVFNRWGQIVFEKKNFTVNSITDGWNGTYQGKPANMDTYVYIIEYLCDNGEIVTLKGNVTLLR